MENSVILHFFFWLKPYPFCIKTDRFLARLRLSDVVSDATRTIAETEKNTRTDNAINSIFDGLYHHTSALMACNRIQTSSVIPFFHTPPSRKLNSGSCLASVSTRSI